MWDILFNNLHSKPLLLKKDDIFSETYQKSYIFYRVKDGESIEYIAEKFNFIGNMMTFVSTNTIFSTLIPVALALGVGIGFVGSCVTIRKHLRV